NVDDGNPCTVGSCDPVAGVSQEPVAAGTSCDDGNECNGVSTCDGAGACQPGTPPEIDTSNPCQVGSCDPILGVVYAPRPAGTSCEDGNLCNGAETCNGAGACGAGVPVSTDDGNACTIGSCDPDTGNVTQDPVPVGAPCGDGDLCNGFEFCDGAGTCDPGEPLDPDDQNPCTIDSCDPLFGVQNDPAPAGQSCADDNVCNGSEACDGFGVCEAGTPPVVDDGNDCTADSCDPITGV